MTGEMVRTFIGLAAVYVLMRPSLKKANGVTRWSSILLLLASGILWIYLDVSVQVPRPANGLNQLLAPFVPVP